ncbi:unnamed protein product, partial [Gulo gulo]
PSPRSWSRCAGLRWEVPSYPQLTILPHSGSTRPEVLKSASESVMQLVTERQCLEKAAGTLGAMSHPCQDER